MMAVLNIPIYKNTNTNFRYSAGSGFSKVSGLWDTAGRLNAGIQVRGAS